MNKDPLRTHLRREPFLLEIDQLLVLHAELFKLLNARRILADLLLQRRDLVVGL